MNRLKELRKEKGLTQVELAHDKRATEYYLREWRDANGRYV